MSSPMHEPVTEPEPDGASDQRTRVPSEPGSHAEETVTADRVHRDAERAIADARDDGAEPLIKRPSAPHPLADLAFGVDPLDERFIPVSTDALIRTLTETAAGHGQDPAAFERLCKLVRTIIEQEADALRRHLERLYDPLNPDRDVSVPAIDPVAQTNDARMRLSSHVAYLLEKANYRRLDRVDIERTLKMANRQGLRVKLREDMIENLELWIRGTGTTTRRFRTRRKPFRGEEQEIPVYRRLVVIARLHDDPMLYLKMYRNIPTADLEALLPHASAAMTTLDKLTIAAGSSLALGGISTSALASSNWLTVAGTMAIPFGIMSWRAFSGYRRARVARDRQLTRNLFYMNLASNNAVLYSLIARTAEEETKEAILAYTAGLFNEPDGFASERQLDVWCEYLLYERFGVRLNFDAPDAIESLDRFALWTDRARFRVHPVHAACEIAERHWSERRSWDYHQRTIAQRASPDAPA